VPQENTARAVKESHPPGKVKVMVGGAPMTQPFAGSIDADNGGRDATATTPFAQQFLADA